MTRRTVGIVGLGKMGRPIARRLLAAGHVVRGANRSGAAVQELAADGLIACAGVAEVAVGADVVLLCLPTESASEEVSWAVLEVAGSGSVLVEHSTISPQLARRVAERAGGRGVGYLDAPVSGGPAGAEAGTLTVMVGGEEDVLDAARPVLEAYGARIHRCGDVGSGEVVKLVNQLLVAVNTAAVAEAAALGQRLGADLQVVLEVISTSFGGSTMLNRNLPRVVAGDFSPATTVRLLRKDLALIHDAAAEHRVDLPLGAQAQRLFTEAADRGLDDLDIAVLSELWSRDGSG